MVYQAWQNTDPNSPPLFRFPFKYFFKVKYPAAELRGILAYFDKWEAS
jgi:hypothetical protein